jgi:hypothetical protein
VSLHKAVIKELEGRITATEAAAEKFELKCQEAQKIMVRGTREDLMCISREAMGRAGDGVSAL